MANEQSSFMSKEFSVTYCDWRHIAKIEQNGGLKQLQKRWSESVGKPMKAEKMPDGSIFVHPRGRNRLNGKVR